MTLCFYHKIFLVIILIYSLSSCNKTEETPPVSLVEVSVVNVQRNTIPLVYQSVGYAESSHPVEIRARVEGYLEEIAYVEGSHVKTGDLLFKLDQRPFIANVEQAKGSLAREKALLWNAQQAVNRLTPLYQKNAASKKDLDDATASLLAAEASVQVAKANLESAEINLSYTVLNSPIDGLAGKSNFREGALISPGPNNLMTSVETLNPIWVYFSISENEILKMDSEVKKHTVILPKDDQYQVEVVLADGSIYPEKGVVNFASPTYNQRTGTLSLRAQFTNPHTVIRPGQFLRVNVYGAVRPDAIYVPQKALLEGKNGMYVYVVREGKAAIQNVEVGDWYGDYWIITEGLKEGELVVVDGVNKVGQNVPVKITKEIPIQTDVSSLTVLPGNKN